tara:strand:- start:4711 stop:5721 length:1011 start_codon:yes stop_codon:yes gene_type:complete
MDKSKVIEFECIDAYTAGNPVRLVVGPKPDLKGKNIAEKRLNFINNFDWIRTGLMFEPHGHDMMSGSFFYDPSDIKNDVSILFIETSGCLPMCGHGLIGAITVLIEEDLVIPKVEGKINVETPAGLVKALYKKKDNKVISVKFNNVASFLAVSNLYVQSDFLGKLKVDVAYGGNFYAIVDIQSNFKGIEYYSASDLISFGRDLRIKINNLQNFVHPLDENIKMCTHVLWSGKSSSNKLCSSNAVFYGEKAIDRSPCGTGTSARLAQKYFKGELTLGQKFIHKSIIDSQFVGCVEEEVSIGNFKGIIPSIEGNARIIGYNKLIFHPSDPYLSGFQVI